MPETAVRARRNRRYRIHARKTDGSWVDVSDTRPLDRMRQMLIDDGWAITRDVAPDPEVPRG